ncbi:cupin domain-containing protein [Allokutzneria sp. A3M-2-11 16]|uniref:cupin domain-containing protein n=1 Tax=Allokutzneria sp. A3M-2-11 16 TaxID=2962043 RepID=UPI0020B71755|nr:cupin domain-containing protein [Allokutzneria sp. A3M-2-11 16]MCP3804856.1 cupin domain-containing protein [Allokutzneria sp. A3M-2-11 16]
MTNYQTEARGRLITEAEQTAVWLLGGLAQIRVPGAATGNTFTVVQHTGKRGYNTPEHVHHYEDELFLVLDGTLRMVCDGREFTAAAGATVVIPRNTPHAFVITSPTAAFLTIHVTPEPGNRPQFDLFLAAELPRAAELSLPPESVEYDLDRLVSLGEEYAFTRVGPAPTP